MIRAVGGDMAAFVAAIRSDAPPLARVDAFEDAAYRFEIVPEHFEIVASEGQGAETRVTPDAATCSACLEDIAGKDPRRAGYVFTNCTHCGLRFTIIAGLPYDRARTSMAHFEMCADCAAEYQDPADRRFHAQPVACRVCGPQLWFETQQGRVEGDALALATTRLGAGDVLAIKGLGGFHLCCDTRNADAIGKLRDRKRRPGKPLALMDHLERISSYAEVNAEERRRLSDPAAPIVLLQRRVETLPDALAPGLDVLGFMLPYTPLHHLLLSKVEGPLVMTSGNLSGEPQGIAFGAHLKSSICLVKNGQALLSHYLGDLDDALTWDEFLKADGDYAELFDHTPAYVACDLHPGYRSSQHAASRAGTAPLIEVQHNHAYLAAAMAENGWPLDGGQVAGIVLDGLGLGSDGTTWSGELLLGDYQGFERIAHLAQVPLVNQALRKV